MDLAHPLTSWYCCITLPRYLFFFFLHWFDLYFSLFLFHFSFSIQYLLFILFCLSFSIKYPVHTIHLPMFLPLEHPFSWHHLRCFNFFRTLHCLLSSVFPLDLFLFPPWPDPTISWLLIHAWSSDITNVHRIIQTLAVGQFLERCIWMSFVLFVLAWWLLLGGVFQMASSVVTPSLLLLFVALLWPCVTSFWFWTLLLITMMPIGWLEYFCNAIGLALSLCLWIGGWWFVLHLVQLWWGFLVLSLVYIDDLTFLLASPISFGFLGVHDKPHTCLDWQVHVTLLLSCSFHLIISPSTLLSLQ